MKSSVLISVFCNIEDVRGLLAIFKVRLIDYILAKEAKKTSQEEKKLISEVIDTETHTKRNR